MGYYSRANGEITYSPELPLYAIRGVEGIHKFTNNSVEYDVSLAFEWNTISPPEDSFKAYWIEEQLTELVTEILKINPDTVFEGYLEIHGEEPGDMWRLIVKDGKVKSIKPKIVWDEDAS